MHRNIYFLIFKYLNINTNLKLLIDNSIIFIGNKHTTTLWRRKVNSFKIIN